MEHKLNLLGFYSLVEGVSNNDTVYNPADAIIVLTSEYQITESFLTDDPDTIIIYEEEYRIPDSHKNFDGSCKPGDFVFMNGGESAGPQVYRLGCATEYCQCEGYFGFLIGTANGLAEYIDEYLDDEIAEVVHILKEKDENTCYTFDKVKQLTLDYLKNVKY